MIDAEAIKKLPTFKMDTATASPATERSGVVQGWGDAVLQTAHYCKHVDHDQRPDRPANRKD